MRLKGLWRDPNFLKFWAGETLSLVGGQITIIALPLLAIIVLNASPGELGILGALQFAPYLLFGLFAGVIVDRLNRKPLMIIADLARALLLLSIPIGVWFDFITIEQLYLVGFLTGVFSLFFDVSYQSYLPTLVGKDMIAEGNSKLQASGSLAQVAGPGIGGILVDLFTAPFAILFDALSFLASALFLNNIKIKEVKNNKSDSRLNIRKEIKEGLIFVFKSNLLRPIAICTGISNFFGRIFFTVFILYLSEDLNLSATFIGVVFGISSAGAFLGAIISNQIVKKIGLGKTITFSILFGNASLLLIFASNSNTFFTITFLLLSQFLWGIANPVYNIAQVSLRQSYTPSHLLGRMNATMRTLVWGTVPLGYLAGGLLGETIGLHSTLLVGGLGGLLPFLVVLFSPVFKLKNIEEVISNPIYKEGVTVDNS